MIDDLFRRRLRLRLGASAPSVVLVVGLVAGWMAILIWFGPVWSQLSRLVPRTQSNSSVQANAQGRHTLELLSAVDPRAQRIWSEVSPDVGPMPWQQGAFIQVDWTVNVSKGSVADCTKVVVVLHPADWQLSALGGGYRWGEDAKIADAIIRAKPETAEQNPDLLAARRVAGSMLTLPLTTKDSNDHLAIVLGVPPTAIAKTSGIGGGLVCGSRLAAFAWL